MKSDPEIQRAVKWGKFREEFRRLAEQGRELLIALERESPLPWWVPIPRWMAEAIRRVGCRIGWHQREQSTGQCVWCGPIAKSYDSGRL